MVRRAIKLIGTGILVLLLLSLVVGQLLGQPVLLAYVESGSMEPTLEPGDGFVAIPSVVSDEPREGDVVVFEAEELDGGGLTTHRIVGETDDGYVTRGDANPFTDQDGGEPPVTDDQIVATALQVNGHVVTIPGLGSAIGVVQGLLLGVSTTLAGAIGIKSDIGVKGAGLLLFGLGFVVFAAMMVADRRRGPSRARRRSRRPENQIDARKLVLVLLVIVLIPANLTMVASSGTTEATIDGDEVADVDGVHAGDTLDVEIEVRNDGLMTMLATLEPTDDAVVDQGSLVIPSGEKTTVTVSTSAPPPGAEKTVEITEHRYLLLLPESVLLSLHSVSPLLALGAINALIAVSVFGLVGGLLGFGRVRFRDSSRDIPFLIALRRRLR